MQHRRNFILTTVLKLHCQSEESYSTDQWERVYPRRIAYLAAPTCQQGKPLCESLLVQQDVGINVSCSFHCS